MFKKLYIGVPFTSKPRNAVDNTTTSREKGLYKGPNFFKWPYGPSQLRFHTKEIKTEKADQATSVTDNINRWVFKIKGFKKNAFKKLVDDEIEKIQMKRKAVVTKFGEELLSAYGLTSGPVNSTMVDLEYPDIRVLNKAFSDSIYQGSVPTITTVNNVMNHFLSYWTTDANDKLCGCEVCVYLEALEKECWSRWQNSGPLREKLIFRFYDESKQHRFGFMREIFLISVGRDFLNFVACPVFVTLTVDELCTLLSSNTIGVNTEEEVLMSAIRWVDDNWDERKEHLERIMKCVRFELMPSWYLATLNEYVNVCDKIDRLIRCIPLEDRIHNALDYTCKVNDNSWSSEEFAEFVAAHPVEIPEQRMWIFDRACDYHHHLRCNYKETLDYALFEEYMNVLKNPRADAKVDEGKCEFAAFVENDVDGIECQNGKCLNH